MIEVVFDNPDAKLEELRQTGAARESQEDVTETLLEVWLPKAKKISLNKIVCSPQGWSMLHVVAKFVDGTKESLPGNWRDLAGHLGFDMLDINRFANFASTKGVTLEIISERALNRSSTLADLLEALYNLKRIDILTNIQDSIDDLLKPKEAMPTKCIEKEFVQHIIGRADVNLVMDSSPLIRAVSSKFELNQIDEDEDLKKKQNKIDIKKVVMLTFAQDGYELAQSVAERIRNLGLGIGVLILEENAEELELCPEAIYRWYQEVDYIIPIITKGYLRQIAPRGKVDDEELESINTTMDSRYARLIFVLMNGEYFNDGSINKRIRPLESSDLIHIDSKRFSLINIPFFGCRKREDKLDTMIQSLAKAKMR